MAQGNDTDAEMRERVAEWIRFHKERLKLSDEELGDAIGVSRDSMLRAKSARREVSHWEVVKLAQFFETDMPIVLSLEPRRPVSNSVFLRNSVAAGVWREEDRTMVHPTYVDFSIIPSPAYAGLAHHARKVDDGHADLFVPLGFYILCVPYHLVRTAPLHDDNVVIQRVRSDLSTKGRLVDELSIRRVVRNGDKWMLKGLCSTPGIVSDIEYSGDTGKLLIVDLIVNRFA